MRRRATLANYAWMLSALYNLLWYPAMPIALAAARPRNLRDVRERLGRGISRARPGAPRIWIHAASVGEVEAVRPIALGLLANHPGAALTITTMTAAGRDAARRRIPNAAAWVLAPLDSPRAVQTFLAGADPNLVLIAESELWPNYFAESARAGAKIAIVNGRLSERSLRRYRHAQSLFKSALGHASLILAQSDEDARRYAELNGGANVVVTGNTKFEEEPVQDDSPIRPGLLAWAGKRRILIAGATAPGEEAVIVGAFRELRAGFPGLALVIAPRHLERAAEIEKLLQTNSLEYLKASALASGAAPARAADVLLLDTMGELRGLYRRAAIAFIGGSLAPGRGGQSPAEAAAAGVPILIGPHHEKQREIVDSIRQAGGARIVRDARDLTAECAAWLSDETARAAAGEHAREASRRIGGGARRALAQIEALLAGA